MTKTCLVTIGITAFREGAWLVECWESVLAQTDDRWQAVVILDGGADEETLRIFEGLSHPRLEKYAFSENVGPYPARNKAFELTTTPYHFYLDADDLLAPDAVKNILGAFEAFPRAGFVYGDIELFGGQSGFWRYAKDVSADDFVRSQPLPGGGCAYALNSWKAVGGFSEELSRGNGDYDFHIALCEAGISGVHCGSILYHLRMSNAPRVSSSYRLSYYKTHELMIARHPNFFSDSVRRRLFLGHALYRSAVANYLADEFTTARKLALRARENGVNDMTLTLIVSLGLLPASINRVVLRSGRFLKSMLMGTLRG